MHSLIPRPFPAFQCCTLKNKRAWWAKSREARHKNLMIKILERGREKPRDFDSKENTKSIEFKKR